MNTLLKHINNGQQSYQDALDESWITFEACISPELKECWNSFKPGMLGIQPDEVEEVRKALHAEDQGVLSVQIINWLYDDKNSFTKDIIIDVFCDCLVL